jgi:hypothetical protein
MLHRAEGFDPELPRVMCHVHVAGNAPAMAAVAPEKIGR